MTQIQLACNDVDARELVISENSLLYIFSPTMTESQEMVVILTGASRGKCTALYALINLLFLALLLRFFISRLHYVIQIETAVTISRLHSGLRATLDASSAVLFN